MRIVVADKDPIGRSALRRVLDRRLGHDVVGEADSFDPVIEIAAREDPDAVVLAVSLFSDVRNEIAYLIASTAAPVVVITSTSTGLAAWHGMHAGASAYLLRDRLANDLPQALFAAEQGGAFISPPLIKAMITYLSDRLEAATEGDAVDIGRLLLPREKETLLRLAGGESTEEIAASMSVASATVRAYVSRILRKLNLRSRGEAIALAYRTGFHQREHR